MRILLFNQLWFADEFRARGHDVLSVGFKLSSCTPPFDYVFEQPLLHVHRVFEALPDGWTPDRLVVYDNSAPIVFTGFEETTIPSAFYSVDTHHHVDWHKYLCNVFDRVFVAQRDYLELFTAAGFAAEWMPLYASRYVEASSQKEYDAVFVGTLDAKLNPDRVTFFEALQQRVPMLVRSGDWWTIFPHSEIVVNQTVKGDLNFRVFEAMMSGALLLTEESPNGLTDLFTSGMHLLTYPRNNVDEAAKKIAWSLAHRDEARLIAAAGRNEVLARHTPQNRADTLLAALEGLTRTRSKSRLFSLMCNFATLAQRLERLESQWAMHALLEAMKMADFAVRDREELPAELASVAAVCCVRYDQRFRSTAGQELLQRLSVAYPAQDLFKLVMVNNLLNTGALAEATEIARQLGHEEQQLTFSRAAQVTHILLRDLWGGDLKERNLQLFGTR